ELTGDRPHLLGGTTAQEGKRDVEVVTRQGPRVAPKLVLLPSEESIEHVLGEGEGAEEAEPVTAFDASSGAHTAPSPDCARSRRTGWGAATVARRRIDSRSEGKLNSIPLAASAATAWR